MEGGKWAVPAVAEVRAARIANGPEDADLGWNAVDWRAAEDRVRRLRQRIFAASRAGDHKRVRSLQKLMLRSRSNALVSVRQVTERNAGRLTSGVDGRTAVSAADKERLAAEIQRPPERARPVRRVFIPKANGKLRPLGIPVIADRARQAAVRNALEPEREARFEPRSYGFRPAGDVMTRSRLSTRSSRARTRGGSGSSTLISREHSTTSITASSSASSARSPPGA